jgi:hypothetical protein
MKQQNEWMTIFQNNDTYNSSSCIKISHSSGNTEIIDIDSAASKYYDWGGFSPILDIIREKESEGWTVISNSVIGSELGYPYTLFFTLRRSILPGTFTEETTISETVKKPITKGKTGSKTKNAK